MTDHHVRVAFSYERIEPWVKGLNGVHQVVVYEHTDAKRIHCHLLFKGNLTPVTTLKGQLEKSLKVKVPRTDWMFPTTYKDKSAKVVPVDNDLITYLYKGKFKTKYVKGFTQDEIDSYESKWVDWSQYPTDSPPKVKEVTYANIVDETIEQYKKLDKDDCYYENVITSLVLGNLRKYRKVCGRYKTRDIIDTVYCWLEIGDYETEVRGLAKFKMSQL